MSYVRSWFYNNIYVPFRDGRFDDALNNASNYKLRQTTAGFRKIYDAVIKTLYMVKRDVEDKSRLRLQLAKLDITIEYQKNRGVLNQDLADGIKAALAEIRRNLGTENAKRLAEALELALNSVLSYRLTKKEKDEEEWL